LHKVNGYVKHQNTRNTCCRIRPCQHIGLIRYYHRHCECSWLPCVLADMFEPNHQTWGISKILEWTHVQLTMATNPKIKTFLPFLIDYY
jgi:hypothetical protein